MADILSGNLHGLPPSQLRRLTKLGDRRIARDDLAPFEVAREITEVAEHVGRRVGLLVNREGQIEHIAVGTRDILYLPDLGRHRFGRGRLRRLRLIFSDLGKKQPDASIPNDVYADLEKLRLDAVISVKRGKNRISAAYAYIVPAGGKQPGQSTVHTEPIKDLATFEMSFNEFMEELDAELAREMALRVGSGETGCVLVGVYDKSFQDWAGSLDELAELARTAGVKVIDRIVQRRTPDPKTLLGKGKLEEVVLHCLRLGAELVVFDNELKPTQWRAITNSTELKVIDRSMLILDIFAQRATSSDGRLQVELAQLKYNLPRLVEMDAGLSRLTGGIGGRGPGETKLEISRRRSRDRIAQLERKIDTLGSQREMRRKRRRAQSLPLVAILGYTNVGKSTLFNLLTGSTVTAENKLFATLDPAQRRLVLPPRADDTSGSFGREVIVSDTVGFIRDLPAELRAAFRATLEELREADVFLHVLDASDPAIAQRQRAVQEVLEEMELADVPQLVVLNKIDRIDAETLVLRHNEFSGVAVSARTGTGIDALKRAVGDMLDSIGRLDSRPQLDEDRAHHGRTT